MASRQRASDTLHTKQTTRGDLAVIAGRIISQGELVFSEDEWRSDESRGWTVLSVDDIEELSRRERYIFLRYSYDLDFGMSIGTFDWTKARHISNFVNHSCAPNLTFDGDDNVRAMRHVSPGEEITLDYGNFIVNFDQDFICLCGSPVCRRRVRRSDWRVLAHIATFGFPRFMRHAVFDLLNTAS